MMTSGWDWTPRGKECGPMKMLPTLVFPVSLSASQPLYVSKLANRIAILGTIPDSTAPRPLYNANGVSRFTISAPVARNPRGFVYNLPQICVKHGSRGVSEPTYSGCPPRARKLHTNFDCVQWLATQLIPNDGSVLLYCTILFGYNARPRLHRPILPP